MPDRRTRAELAAELEATKTALREAEQQTKDVKDKVVEVARRYAGENEWCETVDRALVEAGLIESQDITMTIEITIKGLRTSVAYGREQQIDDFEQLLKDHLTTSQGTQLFPVSYDPRFYFDDDVTADDIETRISFS